MHALIYDIMSDCQRKNFEETHECDFSFELGGSRAFRVNVFMQRKGEAAVFRTIPTKILTTRRVGHAADLQAALRKRKGPDSSHRTDRFR